VLRFVPQGGQDGRAGGGPLARAERVGGGGEPVTEHPAQFRRGGPAAGAELALLGFHRIQQPQRAVADELDLQFPPVHLAGHRLIRKSSGGRASGTTGLAGWPGGWGRASWWSGSGLDGDGVAHRFELVDVDALAPFEVDPGVVEVRAEVGVAGFGI
jgi:hypothetical protein